MPEQPLPWASGSTEALAHTLDAWIREASICDTEGEARFGHRLAALVRSLPYFLRRPGQVAVLPARGEWKPPVIAAWVQGERPARKSAADAAGGVSHPASRPVVVLIGHYDTVGVEDLLALGLDPFDSRSLAAHFAGRASDPVVRRDAASGAYLFGRGGLDMKAGIVAALVALESLARRSGELCGDVLWIAAPDEENLSRGAVAAREWLQAWLEERGARCAGLVNTDYVPGPSGPGGIPAYFGALGKLLPSFLVSGLTAHVGDPLAGLDPITVAAEIVREVSLEPDLREDPVMPPPVPLRLRDLKEAYSVQTAPAAAGYFNLYFAGRPVRRVMEQLVRSSRAAVGRVARRYAALGRPFPDIPVLLRSELSLPAGVPEGGPAAAAPAGELAAPAGLAGDSAGSDPRERARERLMAALEAAGGPRPSVIWHMGPGCWAPVPDPDLVDGGRLRRAVFAAAQAVGAPLYDAGPYPFISDMSVFAGHLDPEDHRFIHAQYAGEPGGLDTLPPAGWPALPCVNLGPCGEGPHSPYERVHVDYSLGTLPRLLEEVALRLLAG